MFTKVLLHIYQTSVLLVTIFTMRRLLAAALVLVMCASASAACVDCVSRKVALFKELVDKKHPVKTLTWCSPGYYDPHTGIGLPMFCQPCGKGFYCEGMPRHEAAAKLLALN